VPHAADRARGHFALSLLLAPLAAQAEQAGNVYRIGFLGPAAERVYTDSLLSLSTGLRELGYVEGKNIVFEHRFAEDQYERLPGLAAELVRDKVDVIVVHSTPGTRAAKQATRTIPIVMVNVADPVGAGLVASLARLSSRRAVVRAFVDARGNEGDRSDPLRVGGGYGQYGNRVWKVMNNRPWLPIRQEAMISEFKAQGRRCCRVGPIRRSRP